MSRYESESRTWGIAARAISARIRALPEFTEARALVIAGAVAECRGCDVPEDPTLEAAAWCRAELAK